MYSMTSLLLIFLFLPILLLCNCPGSEAQIVMTIDPNSFIDKHVTVLPYPMTAEQAVDILSALQRHLGRDFRDRREQTIFFADTLADWQNFANIFQDINNRRLGAPTVAIRNNINEIIRYQYDPAMVNPNIDLPHGVRAIHFTQVRPGVYRVYDVDAGNNLYHGSLYSNDPATGTLLLHLGTNLRQDPNFEITQNHIGPLTADEYAATRRIIGPLTQRQAADLDQARFSSGLISARQSSVQTRGLLQNLNQNLNRRRNPPRGLERTIMLEQIAFYEEYLRTVTALEGVEEDLYTLVRESFEADIEPDAQARAIILAQLETSESDMLQMATRRTYQEEVWRRWPPYENIRSRNEINANADAVEEASRLSDLVAARESLATSRASPEEMWRVWQEYENVRSRNEMNAAEEADRLRDLEAARNSLATCTNARRRRRAVCKLCVPCSRGPSVSESAVNGQDGTVKKLQDSSTSEAKRSGRPGQDFDTLHKLASGLNDAIGRVYHLSATGDALIPPGKIYGTVAVAVTPDQELLIALNAKKESSEVTASKSNAVDFGDDNQRMLHNAIEDVLKGFPELDGVCNIKILATAEKYPASHEAMHDQVLENHAETVLLQRTESFEDDVMIGVSNPDCDLCNVKQSGGSDDGPSVLQTLENLNDELKSMGISSCVRGSRRRRRRRRSLSGGCVIQYKNQDMNEIEAIHLRDVLDHLKEDPNKRAMVEELVSTFPDKLVGTSTDIETVQKFTMLQRFQEKMGRVKEVTNVVLTGEFIDRLAEKYINPEGYAADKLARKKASLPDTDVETGVCVSPSKVRQEVQTPNKLTKFIGNSGKVKMSVDLFKGAVTGDFASMGLIVGLFVTDRVLSAIGESLGRRAAAKVAQLATLGQSSKLLKGFSKAVGPIMGGLTSLYSVYTLVNSIRSFQAGDELAIADIVSDTINLTLDLIVVGALIYGGPTGPILSAAAFVINILVNIGVGIFKSVKFVEALDKKLQLTAWEKAETGWNNFMGLQTPHHLQALEGIQRYNNWQMKGSIEFLVENPGIGMVVMPSFREMKSRPDVKIPWWCWLFVATPYTLIQYAKTGSLCLGVSVETMTHYKRDYAYYSDNTVNMDNTSKTLFVYRGRPTEVHEGFMLNCPPAYKTVDVNFTLDTAIKSQFYCENAIGVHNTASNATSVFIDLGDGNDTVVGRPDWQNIVMVGDDFKDYLGGDRDDIFIIKPTSRFSSPSGLLDGGPGFNSMEIHETAFGSNRVSLYLDDEYVYNRLENERTGFLRIKNMQKVTGRKGLPETFVLHCQTGIVNGLGGGRRRGAGRDDRDLWDEVRIPVGNSQSQGVGQPPVPKYYEGTSAKNCFRSTSKHFAPSASSSASIQGGGCYYSSLVIVYPYTKIMNGAERGRIEYKIPLVDSSTLEFNFKSSLPSSINVLNFQFPFQALKQFRYDPQGQTVQMRATGTEKTEVNGTRVITNLDLSFKLLAGDDGGRKENYFMTPLFLFEGTMGHPHANDTFEIKVNLQGSLQIVQNLGYVGRLPRTRHGQRDHVNMFNIVGGCWNVVGGALGDSFLVHGDFEGSLNGGAAGPNLLSVDDSFQFKDLSVHQTLQIDLPAGFMSWNRTRTVEVKGDNDMDMDMDMDMETDKVREVKVISVPLSNIHRVIGRPSLPDTITATCATEFIDGRGSQCDSDLVDLDFDLDQDMGVRLNDPHDQNLVQTFPLDLIIIPKDLNCTYSMTLVISSRTRVRNEAQKGNFVYRVEQPGDFDIDLGSVTAKSGEGNPNFPPNTQHTVIHNFPFENIIRLDFDHRTSRLTINYFVESPNSGQGQREGQGQSDKVKFRRQRISLPSKSKGKTTTEPIIFTSDNVRLHVTPSGAPLVIFNLKNIPARHPSPAPIVLKNIADNLVTLRNCSDIKVIGGRKDDTFVLEDNDKEKDGDPGDFHVSGEIDGQQGHNALYLNSMSVDPFSIDLFEGTLTKMDKFNSSSSTLRIQNIHTVTGRSVVMATDNITVGCDTAVVNGNGGYDTVWLPEYLSFRCLESPTVRIIVHSNPVTRVISQVTTGKFIYDLQDLDSFNVHFQRRHEDNDIDNELDDADPKGQGQDYRSRHLHEGQGQGDNKPPRDIHTYLLAFRVDEIQSLRFFENEVTNEVLLLFQVADKRLNYRLEPFGASITETFYPNPQLMTKDKVRIFVTKQGLIFFIFERYLTDPYLSELDEYSEGGSILDFIKTYRAMAERLNVNMMITVDTSPVNKERHWLVIGNNGKHSVLANNPNISSHLVSSEQPGALTIFQILPSLQEVNVYGSTSSDHVLDLTRIVRPIREQESRPKSSSAEMDRDGDVQSNMIPKKYRPTIIQDHLSPRDLVIIANTTRIRLVDGVLWKENVKITLDNAIMVLDYEKKHIFDSRSTLDLDDLITLTSTSRQDHHPQRSKRSSKNFSKYQNLVKWPLRPLPMRLGGQEIIMLSADDVEDHTIIDLTRKTNGKEVIFTATYGHLNVNHTRIGATSLPSSSSSAFGVAQSNRTHLVITNMFDLNSDPKTTLVILNYFANNTDIDISSPSKNSTNGNFGEKFGEEAESDGEQNDNFFKNHINILPGVKVIFDKNQPPIALDKLERPGVKVPQLEILQRVMDQELDKVLFEESDDDDDDDNDDDNQEDDVNTENETAVDDNDGNENKNETKNYQNDQHADEKDSHNKPNCVLYGNKEFDSFFLHTRLDLMATGFEINHDKQNIDHVRRFSINHLPVCLSRADLSLSDPIVWIHAAYLLLSLVALVILGIIIVVTAKQKRRVQIYNTCAQNHNADHRMDGKMRNRPKILRKNKKRNKNLWQEETCLEEKDSTELETETTRLTNAPAKNVQISKGKESKAEECLECEKVPLAHHQDKDGVSETAVVRARTGGGERQWLEVIHLPQRRIKYAWRSFKDQLVNSK